MTFTSGSGWIVVLLGTLSVPSEGAASVPVFGRVDRKRTKLLLQFGIVGRSERGDIRLDLPDRRCPGQYNIGPGTRERGTQCKCLDGCAPTLGQIANSRDRTREYVAAISIFFSLFPPSASHFPPQSPVSKRLLHDNLHPCAVCILER